MVLIGVAACAGKRPVVPPERLWTEGNQAMQDEAWELAVERYKAFLDQYPFDANAEEAELRIANAYFHSGRYPEAIAAFGDFERMHPTSPNVPEIEYRRGMAYLAQFKSSDRDQQAVTNALASFKNVVDRHPGTPWADRAALRVRECREMLAAHDADVANFYLARGSLRAAESRLRGLLTEFPDTEATAEVLYEFAGTYRKRDEPEEANLALATLAYHHPKAKLGVEAREELGDIGSVIATSGDPLPKLVARLDAMRTQEDRLEVPATVSAYPDRAPMGGGEQY